MRLLLRRRLLRRRCRCPTTTEEDGWDVRGLGDARFLRFQTRFCQCIPSVLHTQRGDVTVPAWLGWHTHASRWLLRL